MDEAGLGCQASSGLGMVSPQLPGPQVLLEGWARLLLWAAQSWFLMPGHFPCIPGAWTCPSETCLRRG